MEEFLKFLSQQLLHHIPCHVGQAEVATLMAVGELQMVQAQAMEQAGVQVMDVNLVLDHVQAELVGLAHHLTALDAAAHMVKAKG